MLLVLVQTVEIPGIVSAVDATSFFEIYFFEGTVGFEIVALAETYLGFIWIHSLFEESWLASADCIFEHQVLTGPQV